MEILKKEKIKREKEHISGLLLSDLIELKKFFNWEFRFLVIAEMKKRKKRQHRIIRK